MKDIYISLILYAQKLERQEVRKYRFYKFIKILFLLLLHSLELPDQF